MGGAVKQAVTVNAGETIVDNNGQPVTLEVGHIIRPSGCYSSECATPYNGGPVVMDQIVVTYDLISGLTWSDGTPLTATDSVYSFNLAADPHTPTSKFVNERTATYVATSNTQVEWVGLPGYIDSTYFLNFWTPLPEHVWGTYSASQLLIEPTSSRTPMGYGAYVIDEWVNRISIQSSTRPGLTRCSRVD